MSGIAEVGAARNGATNGGTDGGLDEGAVSEMLAEAEHARLRLRQEALAAKEQEARCSAEEAAGNLELDNVLHR